VVIQNYEYLIRPSSMNVLQEENTSSLGQQKYQRFRIVNIYEQPTHTMILYEVQRKIREVRQLKYLFDLFVPKNHKHSLKKCFYLQVLCTFKINNNFIKVSHIFLTVSNLWFSFQNQQLAESTTISSRSRIFF